jgi:hypothetical protein
MTVGPLTDLWRLPSFWPESSGIGWSPVEEKSCGLKPRKPQAAGHPTLEFWSCSSLADVYPWPTCAERVDSPHSL